MRVMKTVEDVRCSAESGARYSTHPFWRLVPFLREAIEELPSGSLASLVHQREVIRQPKLRPITPSCHILQVLYVRHLVPLDTYSKRAMLAGLEGSPGQGGSL